MSRWFVLALALAASRLPARALQIYQSALANGNAVPCPPGVASCVAGLCPGVGHASCTGGTLPLNPFGAAFATQLTWSTELCREDSDGDGACFGGLTLQN